MIGEILPEAIAVAISPTRIMAIVLLLSTPRGTGNAFAFLFGWTVGLVGVGVLAYMVTEPAGAYTNEGPAIWVGWLYVILGAALVAVGLRRFAKRGAEPAVPGWTTALDRLSVPRVAATGFAWVALNPKNAALSVAAATAFAAAGLSRPGSVGVYGLFIVVSTLGLAIPIAMHLAAGERGDQVSAEFRLWLARNEAGIMSVLFLALGALLLGSGLDVLLRPMV